MKNAILAKITFQLIGLIGVCYCCNYGEYNDGGVCKQCEAGYWCDNFNRHQCVAGKYASQGQGSCYSCWGGTYSGQGSSSCTECGAGYYSGAEASSCTPCSPGTASSAHSPSCYSCSAGSSSGSGSSSCTGCGPGTYAAAGSPGCTSCSPGSFTNSNWAHSCSLCNPGQYSTIAGATSCSQCSAGTYSAAGSGSCTPCEAGTYSGNGAGSCNPCGGGSYAPVGSTTCSLCSAGTFSIGGPGAGSCTPCSAGTFSGNVAASCNQCSAGQYSNAGAVSCQPCSGGTYSAAGAGSCSTCNAGSYSNNGAASCLSCGSGTYSVAGSSSCSSCPGGTYSGSGAGLCTNCSAGYVSLGNAASCTICGPGTYAAAGVSTCSFCTGGTFSAGGVETCTACGGGEFSSSGASSCLSCSAGSYSAAGSSTCSSCPAGTSSAIKSESCTNCPAGTYSTSGSSCTPCVGGKFSAVGASSCSICSGGTYSASGSSSCTTCSTGYYAGAGSPSCSPCPAGTFSAAGDFSCTNCPDGSTSTGGSGICTTCSAGTYSVSGSLCFPCSGGYFSAAGASLCSNCGAGTYSVPGSSGCTTCNVGTFALSTSSICIPCAGGTYSAAGASTCIQCGGGTYSLAGASSCITCGNGQYSALGSGFCSACSAGTWSLAGATTCTGCNAGTFSTAGSSSCSTCPGGTYSLNNAGSCTTCGGGTYSIAGSSSCTNCNAGTYSGSGYSFCVNCPAGEYSGSASTSCINCPAGTIPAPGSSSCTSCSPGQFSNAGDSTCSACSAGLFSLGGAGSCTQCGLGTYSLAGAGSCTLCPAGTSSNVPGATSCGDCIAGTFSSAGSALCTNCPSGKYSAVRSASCTNCAIDTYSSSPGSAACTACGPGQFAPLGSTSCEACHSLCKYCSTNSSFDCRECYLNYPNVSMTGSNCHCQVGYFIDPGKSAPNFCQPCHEFCASCSPDKYTCQVCIDNPRVKLNGTRCECQEGNGWFIYTHETGLQECATCYPLCSSCFGPKSTQCISCNTEKDAVYQYPDTCVCKQHMFYLKSGLNCASCHGYCDNCFGATNEECNGCSSIAYKLEDKPTVCVERCPDAGPYFTSGRICKSCHLDCESCVGMRNNDCILCLIQKKFQYQGSCVDSCPLYYTPFERICVRCHYTCKTCVNSTSFGCLTCATGFYLYERKCLSSCPARYYANIDVCSKCVTPCEECISYSKCITCDKGSFLNPYTKDCSATCPDSTFADYITRTCIICHYTCYTCAGETRYDCIICNFARGFARNSGTLGECYNLVCVNGDFMLVDTIGKSAKCAKCDPTCETCNGEGRDSCITCQSDLISMKSPKGISNSRCVACNELGAGFRNPVGTEVGCQGICGDGLRRADEECDDGNFDDGDGCSSKCQIENGFKCTFSDKVSADVCISILPLTVAIQSVDYYNSVTVSFSEYAKCDLNLTQFVNKMNITLENAESNCPFSWTLNSPYQRNAKFLRLVFKTKIKCFVRGDGEKLRIKFPTSPTVKDLYNSSLKNPEIVAKLHRKPYISEIELAIMSNGGSGFSISTFITFGISVIPALLQSVAIGQFWAFVNMIQIISYIPTMRIIIPVNFQILLTQYLTIGQISIPFNVMPAWVPNPKTYVIGFLTAPLTDCFSTCGLDSITFIYNFCDQLFTWILITAFYIGFSFLELIRPEDRFLFIKKMKEEYEYNIVIRILLETYLHMCVCSFINVYGKSVHSLLNQISLASASIALVLAIGFMVVASRLVEKHSKTLESTKFKERYGTLTEGLKTKGSCFVKGYNPIYLFRRIIYAILLVVLTESPQLQLVLCLLVAVIPKFAYLVVFKPFETKSDNFLNLMNEGILIIIFAMLIMLQIFKFTTANLSLIGWIMCGFVLLSLLITWIILLPVIAASLWQMFNDIYLYFTKKEEATSESVDANAVKDEVENKDSTNITEKDPNIQKAFSVGIERTPSMDEGNAENKEQDSNIIASNNKTQEQFLCPIEVDSNPPSPEESNKNETIKLNEEQKDLNKWNYTFREEGTKNEVQENIKDCAREEIKDEHEQEQEHENKEKKVEVHEAIKENKAKPKFLAQRTLASKIGHTTTKSNQQKAKIIDLNLNNSEVDAKLDIGAKTNEIQEHPIDKKITIPKRPREDSDAQMYEDENSPSHETEVVNKDGTKAKII